ncbi:hypothetical protein FIBSPDRAFT_277303 [Athelia psychrophila]|uniref:Uncharacterized protein n=1 Tax=Athelia psychrophila TaxID=1759441 RepID=A0A165WPI1_9AGAM|nr:hypothetical protein FIBSPDRAFT_277303 [Fibularhizoctonia sp. CBS 109695]
MRTAISRLADYCLLASAIGLAISRFAPNFESTNTGLPAPKILQLNHPVHFFYSTSPLSFITFYPTTPLLLIISQCISPPLPSSPATLPPSSWPSPSSALNLISSTEPRATL